jgi:hypothetical protein|tara:strand:+ start:121 stop:516 length:396 start_codon:yes stop_codon:yes gene_type:complete
MDEELKIGSNRSFGIVFSIFFVLVNTYFYYKDGSFSLIIFLISFVFLILGLINSKILTPLNFLWFKFGILLSKIISPIIMSFIFFIVVTPLAILAKIFKKDFLNLDKTKNLKKNSYWIDKEKYKNSMKDQF